MTQKEKQLLLIDLCARLPYGVTLNVTLIDKYDDKVNRDILLSHGNISHIFNNYWIDYKPYLRPISSMTYDEQREYLCISISLDNPNCLVDWLNFHHFDYRGLIEKGLALKAKEGMYKMEE